MKVALITLTALSLFIGATPISARDYSWRDYDCRRHNRLTDRHAAVINYVGRLYPGDLIKSHASRGWRRVPFI